MADSNDPSTLSSDKNPSDNCDNELNTCNPSLSSELQAEEIAIMKGDAIGDTLYSERFVLSTLIQLTKYTDFNESLEKELCTLWDMTIERDVVLLLLEHNSLELIANIIQNETNERLTEILVGIVANMSCLSETRKKLCFDKKTMEIFLDVINTQDPLILIQLMRFITSVLIFENSGDEYVWFQHFENKVEFIDQLAFILHNSTNSILILNALEALISMCAKFVMLDMEDNSSSTFMRMFVKGIVVSGVIEAFKQTTPIQLLDGDDTNLPTQKQQKICNLFLEINCILTQYGNHSIKIYEEHISEILSCMNVILHPLTKIMYLVPFTQNTQGIVENITEILSSLDEPFDIGVIIKLYTIWNLADIEINKFKKESADVWEKDNSNNSQEESICGTNICMAISDYYIKIISKLSDKDFIQIIQNHFTFDMIQELGKKLLNIGSEEANEAYNKIRKVSQAIWTKNIDQ